jgi:hypothetical protein
MDSIIVGILIIATVVIVTIISVNLTNKPKENYAQPWNNCANKENCYAAYTRQPGGCFKTEYYPKM